MEKTTRPDDQRSVLSARDDTSGLTLTTRNDIRRVLIDPRDIVRGLIDIDFAARIYHSVGTEGAGR